MSLRFYVNNYFVGNAMDGHYYYLVVLVQVIQISREGLEAVCEESIIKMANRFVKLSTVVGVSNCYSLVTQLTSDHLL